MEIIIQPTAENATSVAALIIARLLRQKPDAVLGLATGSSPLLLYRKLIALHLDWSRVTTFNLDESLGLPPDHPQSSRHFMELHLFQQINLDPRNIHMPDGMAQDVPEYCARYEHQIRAAGGIDLQVLGIGTEGHIGFNEPTSSLASRTRIKTLTPQTRQDNARFFGSEAQVPHHCLTMGIGTIMDARANLLLAFGNSKARAIAGAVEGPVTSLNPASVLQMHPTVKVCLDSEAASLLQKSDYYRWVWDHKPDWQQLPSLP